MCCYESKKREKYMSNLINKTKMGKTLIAEIDRMNSPNETVRNSAQKPSEIEMIGKPIQYIHMQTCIHLCAVASCMLSVLSLVDLIRFALDVCSCISF